MTNVPAQALTLLNDPFVIAEAEECAKRLLTKPAESVDTRVAQLFAEALGARPDSSRAGAISRASAWSWPACMQCPGKIC